jgi:hypothetical protein
MGKPEYWIVYRTFREEETIMKRIAMLAALALAVGIGGVDSSAQPCSDSNTCATNGQATTPPQATPSPCNGPDCARPTPALENGLKDLSNATEHALKTQQAPVTAPDLQKAFKELSNETEHALKTQQVPGDERAR